MRGKRAITLGKRSSILRRWFRSDRQEQQNLQGSSRREQQHQQPRREQGNFESKSSFLAAVKACSCAKDLREGRRLHSSAVANGLVSSIVVANALVSMFAKCGSLADSRAVFDEMAVHDVVSWNSLILGYAEIGEPESALELFDRMRREGFTADNRTYVAALMACIALGAQEEMKRQHGKKSLERMVVLEKGREIHAQASSAGYGSNIYVANTLINMYSKLGCLAEAREVFDRIGKEERSVVSWTAMMMGCNENGDEQESLELFRQMQRHGCPPNSRTFVATLMACAGLAEKADGSDKAEYLEKGRAIHTQAVKGGCGSDVFFASTLIHMYCKCGSLEDARAAFQRMQRLDVVSWNALILGHVENGESQCALEIFGGMKRIERHRRCSPNARTFVAALMACSSLTAKEAGKQVDGKLVKPVSLKRGMDVHSQAVQCRCETELFVATTLIDMYSKCGSMVEARKCFDKMPSRNVVTWNSLILGYAENGDGEQALQAFRRMKANKRLVPDTRTYAAVLMACGSMASLETARDVHSEIRGLGLDQDGFIANCLVDCYCNCGSLEEAKQVFDALGSKNVVSWSSLIAGYSRHGHVKQALDLFQTMQDGGFQADKMTFTSILTACSHAGLVEKGKELFELMASKHGVEPDMDHYHCMIDLLGRANHLEEAVAMAEGMPFDPNAVTWKTVLGACQKWNNVRIARVAFERLRQVDEEQAAPYVLMANIFGSSISSSDKSCSNRSTRKT
ncbi:pentatricopeptide repeat-containing protein DOT4, chloroplastic-like [Selaginella moellendorffii]|uniref:pentatricopeptide repeat-containing protein DOT4, chloroplastic-like n=1 Tax=Selaginella moellendorffii TaxID=88036 RepID=UPI000D1CE22D|nr:pentatricopeptide repeat-containing protein DOT4, chloroplastic-like [Selaginella moellendorffii]|eukprot:XP_024537842.1 pentatricopeptide repeat-containing protein DOT4, chloroplastic-like [Selaginella moellendorffii]